MAVDHASRLLVEFAVFERRPTSFQVYSFLGRAIGKLGSRPRVIITDQGKEFSSAYRSWCRRHGIRPRYGAVGKSGSIAIVERFIRSMKSECTRRIIMPFRLNAMRHELGCYVTWYNEHRPHTALGGRTPREVYLGLSPAHEVSRFEPRVRWPRESRCASPVVRIKGRRGPRLRLVISSFEGRPHLPVVELRRAA